MGYVSEYISVERNNNENAICGTFLYMLVANLTQIYLFAYTKFPIVTLYFFINAKQFVYIKV